MSKKIVIDVDSLASLSIGGRKLSHAEVLNIFKKQDVLLYKSSNGKKPFVFDFDNNFTIEEDKGESKSE